MSDSKLPEIEVSALLYGCCGPALRLLRHFEQEKWRKDHWAEYTNDWLAVSS